MNLEHFKEQLLARRRELSEAIARVQPEERMAGDLEVRDSGDRAVADEATDQALQEASTNSENLQQVEDALRRIEEGSYGKCVICGKPIEQARLEAIPWTPYCLADQKELEVSEAPPSL